MSTCCGLRRKSREEDLEALLPQYEDDTDLQRRLHQKMHTYQMVRALSQGYMPSNEQLIVNLRTLIASDILNPENPDLSASGKDFARYTKKWLVQLIELLIHKNDRDQIQDFIWYMSKAGINLDARSIRRHAETSRARADATAAYESLRTVGSLLLTNSDFRLFLGDLNTIGRQVFADTALSLSNVAGETAKAIEPSETEVEALAGPGSDQGPAPTSRELVEPTKDVAKVVGEGLAQTGQDTVSSVKENFSGKQKDTALSRLKQAVLKLRQRNDYSESVSTISLLVKRYAQTYSRAADSTISAVRSDIEVNEELDRATKNFWLLLSSFGDQSQWKALEQKFEQVMSHSEKDPEFEELMVEVGNSLQKLLTDPSFFESADEKLSELKEKSENIGNESSLRKDVDMLLIQARTTMNTALGDKDVASLIATSTKLFETISPQNSIANEDLLSDALQTAVPMLIALVQHVPIPRLEVSVPELDLLLENLILEPGATINSSSFLPYKLNLTSTTDFTIRKARFRTATSTSTLLTLRLDGLSLRAQDVGYWLRLRSGLLRFTTSGLASVALDERGLDIHLDISVHRSELENVLTLESVRVNIHKLSYNLRRTRIGFFTWILKPLITPILKRVLESQLSAAVAELLHAANRELVFARERLRATRIADPQDLTVFVKAVLARLTPEEDPDVYTGIGIRPSKGVFKGVYAPGSLVKLWEEEGQRAKVRVEEGAEEDFKGGGWRNEIFDVPVGNSILS